MDVKLDSRRVFSHHYRDASGKAITLQLKEKEDGDWYLSNSAFALKDLVVVSEFLMQCALKIHGG